MRNYPGHLVILLIGLIFAYPASAQDTSRTQRLPRNIADSTRLQPDSMRKQSDTARLRRGGALRELFADSGKLTSSDFQLQIEKTYLVMNNVGNKSELGLPVKLIKQRQADTDSMLAVLKDNVLNNSAALNLRNLQVFKTLLLHIQVDCNEDREVLDSTENKLIGLRNSMKTLVGDTVMRQLWRDSVLRQQFAPQLKGMREVFRGSTKKLKESLADINHLQTQVSSNVITTSQLLDKVNALLSTSGARIFGKEHNFLWEKDTTRLSASARHSLGKAYDGERKALKYYFKDSSHKRLYLLLIGVLFFIWLYRNIRTLRRMNAMNSFNHLEFEYLPHNYIVAAFIMMFAVAPLFDLQAPSVYIESMQFLMLVILTIICWKKWPRRLFVYWVAVVILFICFAFTHHMADPGFWQRNWLILLNLLSVVFGILFLSQMQQHLPMRGFLRFVIILHNVMNVISVLCNMAGRVSLAQILGSSAIFAFTQAIGLAVFSKICLEAILQQIVASRLRRHVQGRLNYQPVLAGFRRPILFLAVVLWLIVFATNLNIYTAVLQFLGDFLTNPRHIGNASFTLGGVLLFFFIIWIAHLLQKYVGYFFGDTGSDDEIHNKGQRSRLLIARLVLLCVGYLLAVAASGVPVDKITIVLGALGVGIGLGLQNIVNNFVSGIILIFDRPLQIGDVVEIGDKSGRVREIGLRSSTLLTGDGAEVIIPNGDVLSQQIVNWTLSNNQQRLEMDLTVKGNADMEVITSTVKKAILASGYIYESREPSVLFTKVYDDGFDLKVYFWCIDVSKSGEAKSAIMILLYQALKKEGIQII
ncbi:mechanosensitive ion channel [Niastella caeni]|uniref:Mechanosensitive ion channel n=1 Tax=Niastella caeni TaxID=2569763 RepID=A0A4S8HSP0_9BACT|nr:mechanosensitive ion channel domain-containing protein [Niastella caeni]THU38305.1 mechanosensitive ion channel [Niastella caeni]